jgi:hypothetical protein
MQIRNRAILWVAEVDTRILGMKIMKYKSWKKNQFNLYFNFCADIYGYTSNETTKTTYKAKQIFGTLTPLSTVWQLNWTKIRWIFTIFTVSSKRIRFDFGAFWPKANCILVLWEILVTRHPCLFLLVEHYYYQKIHKF